MKLEIIKLIQLRISNFLCNIGIHKWIYKTENITYTLGSLPSKYSHGSKNEDIIIPTNVRKCDRCDRKEHQPYMYAKWKYFNVYTKEEKRDSKLKMLIGEIE